MKTRLTLLTISILISCKGSSNQNKPDAKLPEVSQVVKPVDTLKKIDDVKMALLDARCEKAEILLGKPDIKGRIMMGRFYYALYYNKIKGQMGLKKNLLLLIDGSEGLGDRSPIYRIHTIGEGQTIYGAGNNFQHLIFSDGKLSSNSRDFTSLSGDTDWNKVF